ncbi:glycosyltransferase family 4 protein [Fulvivirgaceae bacterium BMA12]|uniref:Glycosyltransferase family 4 protein n=1 Tax=Agaribacillus aureus TaxID=3051825 RepID=A0ABT8LGV9_9BACT|nr:glycosyltransferase family 4 protein [Fulvivirgaceae bacterium BMA12]
MKKVLFVAAHRPNRSPSQKFRFEQYLSFLKEHGYDYDFSYIISAKDDHILYQPGKYLGKLAIFLKSSFKRWKDAMKASSYDIIFIQREGFMTGSTFFEKRFSKSKAKVIFDFDDAIWLQDVSPVNNKLAWLKNPDKTKDIIALSDMIFAGNQYLADYASKFNQNIRIIPTTIDTKRYTRIPSQKDKVCIGWSGSFTTIKHFEYGLDFLRAIKNKYKDKVYFKVIGDPNYVNEEFSIQGVPWTEESEIKELSEIDIGIMPLPNDEWAKGKCGLKGLQYMALETATIMSPVGVNTTIVRDGENGFLADSTDEWIEKLSQLIESSELREKLGKNGRETVLDNYSVSSQQNNYLKYFDELVPKQ